MKVKTEVAPKALAAAEATSKTVGLNSHSLFVVVEAKDPTEVCPELVMRAVRQKRANITLADMLKQVS